MPNEIKIQNDSNSGSSESHVAATTTQVFRDFVSGMYDELKNHQGRELAESNLDESKKFSPVSHMTSGLDLASLNLQAAAKDFKVTEDNQGFLGRSYDWMKNHIGTSAESGSTIGKVWSHVISSDTGSVAVQKKLDQGMGAIVDASSDALNPDHSKASEVAASIVAKQAIDSVNKYDQSQKQGVETLSDALAVGAVLASRKLSILGSALIGSASKTVAKFADGAYSNPGDDIITGGMMGLALPVGRLAGTANGVLTGMIEADLSKAPLTNLAGQIMHKVYSAPGRIAMSMATEGAVVGWSQDSVQSYKQFRDNGDDRPSALSKSFSHPLLTEATGLGMLTGGLASIGRIATIPEFYSARVFQGVHDLPEASNPELVNSFRTAGKAQEGG
ncbi:MAG: hypothetical protein P4L53_24405 [Candidatus Obscuribacterales bacterium]|nr:hypothetical protein [Candidatus Obscuribacterales bacterium]